jgi:enoyl-CoA hydratase/carnithine racemase
VTEVEGGITVDPPSDAGVVTVWLDRPDQGNAFTWDMQERLHAVFAELDDEDAVRSIVVTGRGRFFSTGAGLEPGAFGVGSEEQLEGMRRDMARRIRPWTMRTPIVGALNGAAVGMGLTLPMQWDIRVAALEAKYGFVFNRRGVMPEFNSLWLLPRLIGMSAAVELLLTGRIFTGAEAVDLGVAHRAVEADQVLTVALGIATDLAEHTAPVSTTITKQMAYQFLGAIDREEAFNEEWELFRWLGRQSDAREGVDAYLAKRAPSWTMSKATERPTVTSTWEAFRE